jgi:hypothetical protein
MTIVENPFSRVVPLRNPPLKMYLFLGAIPLREPSLKMLFSRTAAYVNRLLKSIFRGT